MTSFSFLSGRLVLWWLFPLCVGMASCTQEKPSPAPPSLPPAMMLTEVPFSSLPGSFLPPEEASLRAFRRSCQAFSRRPDEQMWIGPNVSGGTVGDWKQLCHDLERALPPTLSFDAQAFQAFLAERLQPYLVSDTANGPQGTFTGYYEIVLKGCLVPTSHCRIPLYGLPPSSITVNMGVRYADMKGVTLTGWTENGRVEPMPTRKEIETGALEGKASVVAWADDPVEAHLLHIQGSGRLSLPDGTMVRVGYAGNNGHSFKGLGRILLDSELIGPDQASMPLVRAWLQANPAQAETLMRENSRFIFFRLLDTEGPIGALGVPLEPGYSLAVDTRFIPLGVPVWLDTMDPDGVPLQRLMFAQDVGSAVKGTVRGDFFWGGGEEAFAMAGRMKSRGTYYILLPKKRAPHKTR